MFQLQSLHIAVLLTQRDYLQFISVPNPKERNLLGSEVKGDILQRK